MTKSENKRKRLQEETVIFCSNDDDKCPSCGARSSCMFAYVDDPNTDYYECRSCGNTWADK